MNIKIAQAHKYSSDQNPLPLSSSFLISLSPSSYFRSLHLGLNLSWTQTNGFSHEIIEQHFSDP